MALSVASAVGFWAANIAVLWASFEAFGGDVPFGVLVQGFFIGMAANLRTLARGGVGSVDAGLIAAFVLFDIDTSIVFPAVLTYRVIAFWLRFRRGSSRTSSSGGRWRAGTASVMRASGHRSILQKVK